MEFDGDNGCGERRLDAYATADDSNSDGHSYGYGNTLRNGDCHANGHGHNCANAGTHASFYASTYAHTGSWSGSSLQF